jgi:predicted Rossmann fold nucleotide-binding protein DprA/Smf involved in DNA uptake
MAALSEATIIVEAGETSGTRTQARACIDQGKMLVFLPRVVESVTWARALIDRGAKVAASVTEAMDEYGYDDGMNYAQGGGQGQQSGQGNRRGYGRGQGSRRGYRGRDSMGRYTSRRGYDGSYGYHEHMEDIRSEMQSASPEEREKMKRELREMLGM